MSTFYNIFEQFSYLLHNYLLISRLPLFFYWSTNFVTEFTVSKFRSTKFILIAYGAVQHMSANQVNVWLHDQLPGILKLHYHTYLFELLR